MIVESRAGAETRLPDRARQVSRATCLDFRTLLASVSVLDALARAEPATSKSARRRQILQRDFHPGKLAQKLVNLARIRGVH
jgi:hypothetical protein